CLSSENMPFHSIPPEVLENIAFFCATSRFQGPPSGLLPLLSLNHRTNGFLACDRPLYARIFAYKFDVNAIAVRLGQGLSTAEFLTSELQRRFIVLKRIRRRRDSVLDEGKLEDPSLSRDLFSVYVMILENQGRNMAQLCDYAELNVWLREFWFHPSGTSRFHPTVKREAWPVLTPSVSIALWLLLFALDFGKSIRNVGSSNDLRKPDKFDIQIEIYRCLSILKLYSLAAHKYPLSWASWTDFVPRQFVGGYAYIYAGQMLVPPPPTVAAIIAYITISDRLAATSHVGVASYSSGRQLEVEWGKCSVLQPFKHNFLPDGHAIVYKYGSVEGAWQGVFTYSDFSTYAAVLGGGTPQILLNSGLTGQTQTWIMSEYHLDPNDLSALNDDEDFRPSHLFETVAEETRDGLIVRTPGGKTYKYHRYTVGMGSPTSDIFITGEGHSAWGRFRFLGRVRPSDGFIVISKTYADGQRDKWFYRGYLLGDTLAGRWRDTHSPNDLDGYEGCFMMSRRAAEIPR
ncbi:hypothetical protein FISHEDRAFT_50592, partial [Fistulina hepatica ATCC 64428]